MSVNPTLMPWLPDPDGPGPNGDSREPLPQPLPGEPEDPKRMQFPGAAAPLPFDSKTRARFLAKTRRNGDCWEWTAARRRGYGIFNVGTKRANNNRTISAHRYAYELFVGPVPDGLQLDHLCGNPPCVNAAHLEPVTARENTLRSRSVAAERARRTQCPKGHSDYMIRKGRRECRICRLEDGRQGRAERYRRAALRNTGADQ